MDAVATVNVLTTINNDVKLEKTRTVHFALKKSSTRFEMINKLDRDYSYRQFLSLVCPQKYHETLFLSHQSKSACADGGYRESTIFIDTIMHIVFPPSPPPPPLPKKLRKHCFQFLLGITVIPREIEDNG